MEDEMPEVISHAFTKVRQGYRYTRTEGHEGFKLRVSVHVDSYDFQSSAKVDVWNPLQLEWSPVVHWEGERFHKRMASPYVPVERQAEQESDSIELAWEILAEAREILG